MKFPVLLNLFGNVLLRLLVESFAYSEDFFFLGGLRLDEFRLQLG